MGDYNSVPVACSHAIKKFLPVFLFQILFVDDKNIGLWIKPDEFVTPCVQQMIGNYYSLDNYM